MAPDAAPNDPRAVIEALNRTINAHDITAQRAFYAPDALLVTAGGRTLDLDGLCRMLDHSMAAFPDLKMTVLRWVVDGETVATEEVMEGTHDGEFGGLAPSHLPVRLPMVHITTVRGGRIVERIAYHDTAGILRQLSGPGPA